jgi:hypothetical protein
LTMTYYVLYNNMDKEYYGKRRYGVGTPKLFLTIVQAERELSIIEARVNSAAKLGVHSSFDSYEWEIHEVVLSRIRRVM